MGRRLLQLPTPTRLNAFKPASPPISQSVVASPPCPLQDPETIPLTPLVSPRQFASRDTSVPNFRPSTPERSAHCAARASERSERRRSAGSSVAAKNEELVA